MTWFGWAAGRMKPPPIAVALTALAAGPLAAQQPGDSTVVLDSMIVEALRLPTSLADAPFAVGVLGPAHTRAARSGDGLAEILQGVPGIQASDRESDALGDRIVIRGAGARAAFGVRGLRVLIDGIPATLPDGQTDLSRLDLATVSRIEVIRGPASALYGNASGGVLRVTSAPPPDAPLAVRGVALGGSHGLMQLHARVAGSPGTAWYDASGTHRRSAGFRDFSESSKMFVRAAGGLPLAGGDLALQLTGNRYDADNPGSLNAALAAEDPKQAWTNNVAQRTGEEAQQVLGGATWAGLLGPGTLELAGYGTARALENPIPPAIIEVDRVVTGARAVYGIVTPLALAFGSELDWQRDDRRNFANEAGARGATTLDQLERVRALGLFAHARVPIGARFDASAGVRYDRFLFEVDDRLVDADPDDSGSRTMDAFSPSVALHARVARTIDLFVNYATAFETPTTTELANRPDGAGGFNAALDPQRTRSFEAGVRGRADALRWELTGWRSRTEDALVPFEVPTAPGRQFYRNAGSTESRGVELALAARLPFGVDASLAWAWIDARFDEFTVDGISFADNAVPGIAPHRVDAALSRRTRDWMLALEATHTAAVPVNDANDAEADAWTTLDLRGELRVLPLGDDAAWLFAGIDNVTDVDYVGSVVVNQGGGRWYEPAPDRTFYVGLRAGFE